ncbi:MAG TPA: hypothetical protein VFO39_23050 [Candidatus Sulfotelmatobacter sp.]|nr:hypothetical protein [Candidatus Sulfotelmatobacter sp.]
MRRRYLSELLLCSIIVLTYLAHAQKETLILGVLEDTPGHYAGEPHYRSVRVVFSKFGTDWKAFPTGCYGQKCAAQFPAVEEWTIAFDGREIGRVSTRNSGDSRFYSEVGQQSITSMGPPPTVGKPSQDFAGWVDQPVLRPLVAVSKPNYSDPERWRPFQLPAEIAKRLRSEFRRKFPKVSNCDDPEANNEKPWPYQDSNIKVVRAYSSNAGWSVVRVELEPYRCDGPVEEAFIDQWFSISPAQEIKFLDKAMWLVDAGDYDNDGHSELVFSIDDYNRGGYRLFYDHFNKEAVFEFSYH